MNKTLEKMLKHLSISLVAALSILTFPTVQAATYNLAGDWSDSSNPNGAWTYLRGGIAFPGIASNWSGFGPAWADNGGFGFGFTPMLLKYDGVGSEGVDAVQGDIIGHTNSGDGNSGAGELSVRFTNPVTGTAQITGTIWDAHITVDRDQDWKVFVNDVLKASGTVAGDGTEGRSNPDTFDLASIFLIAGDRVDLLLSRAPGQVGGVVGLDLNIDVVPVPLPAAAFLLAPALGGLGFVRRRAS